MKLELCFLFSATAHSTQNSRETHSTLEAQPVKLRNSLKSFFGLVPEVGELENGVPFYLQDFLGMNLMYKNG